MGFANNLKHRRTPKLRFMSNFLSGKVNLKRSSANVEIFLVDTMLVEPDTFGVAPKDEGIKIFQNKICLIVG